MPSEKSHEAENNITNPKTTSAKIVTSRGMSKLRVGADEARGCGGV
jgi:hypothetical protein